MINFGNESSEQVNFIVIELSDSGIEVHGHEVTFGLNGRISQIPVIRQRRPSERFNLNCLKFNLQVGNGNQSHSQNVLVNKQRHKH